MKKPEFPFLSFCTGIGGIDIGLEKAGLTCIGQVEIDPDCHKILNRHFPGKRKGNDVTTYKHTGIKPRLIVFGFPCQDLSMAGKRKGLGGERSGLFYPIADIVEELKPELVMFENVPGLLSSWSPVESAPSEIPDGGWDVEEGSDFEAVLLRLSQLGYYLGGGVLDSQYFGVPQRRDRVVVIGSLGSASAAEIFFESDCVCGYPAPSRKQKEDGAPFVDARAGRSGETGFATSRELAVAEISGTLDTKSCIANRGCPPNESEFIVGTFRASDGGPTIDQAECYIPTVSRTLTTNHDGSPTADGRGYEIVAPTLLARGNKTGGVRPPGTTVDTAESLIVSAVPLAHLDVSPAVTSKWAKGTGGPSGDECQNLTIAVAPPLTTRPYADNDGQEDKLIAFSCKDHGSDAGAISPTLRSMQFDKSHMNGGGQVAVAFDTTQITSKSNRSNPRLGDPCHTLSAGAHAPAIAVRTAQTGANGIGVSEECAHTLDGASGQAIMRYGVRRLTPKECERLQGFDDDFTAWGLDESRARIELSDSARYRMLGNAVTTTVAYWVGTRLMAIVGKGDK